LIKSLFCCPDYRKWIEPVHLNLINEETAPLLGNDWIYKGFADNVNKI